MKRVSINAVGIPADDYIEADLTLTTSSNLGHVSATTKVMLRELHSALWEPLTGRPRNRWRRV